jgi:DNA polymerase-1
MQLVTERCIIWDPMKDKVHDPATIREAFDLEPRQMIDVMGLVR